MTFDRQGKSAARVRASCRGRDGTGTRANDNRRYLMTQSITRLVGFAVLATATALPAMAQTAPKPTTPDRTTMPHT